MSEVTVHDNGTDDASRRIGVHGWVLVDNKYTSGVVALTGILADIRPLVMSRVRMWYNLVSHYGFVVSRDPNGIRESETIGPQLRHPNMIWS